MTRGIKFNKDKPRMSLIPHAPMRAVAYTFTYGEKKYDAHNWSKGLNFSELLDSAERHIGSFKDGENLDKESNLHHLAHAIACLIYLLWFIWRDRRELDDRLLKDNKGWGRNFFTKMKEPPIKLREGSEHESGRRV